VQDVNAGGTRPLAPEGVTAYRGRPISPDGRSVVALVPGEPRGHFVQYPVDGGEPRPIAGRDAGDRPVRWSADGRFLFVRAPGTGVPAQVDRLEVSTGRRAPWARLEPADPAGIDLIGDIVMTPDGRYYLYQASRLLSDLYLAEGLK
jgi:hypothetical protein